MDIFSDFLLKSNEFQTLFRYSKENLISGVKKVNLVEVINFSLIFYICNFFFLFLHEKDLLPVFFENLTEFHDVLRLI